MNQNDVYLSLSSAWNDLELALNDLNKMDLNQEGETLKNNIQEAMNYFESLFLDRKNIIKKL